MLIYKAETGLEKLLENQSVSYASLAEISSPFDIVEPVKAKLTSKASQNDFDLHYLKTILVTTGWNKNDDVFDRGEVWSARHTPEDKPFNYEHDCARIIGHITGNYVIDADGKAISETSKVDELPKKFHIVTQAVLYKYWDKPELQELMDKVLAEIAAGGWYVSMEALFKGFDYCLLSQNQSKVIARNEETAFLTKHLRAYGGDGVYENYKVGRLLRNITFSGKGLVRKPANPESEILQTQAELGYIVAGNFTEVKKMNELELIKDKLASANKEIDGLKAALQESDVKEWKIKLEQADAARVKAEESLKQANENLEKAVKAKEALDKAHEELAKALEIEKKNSTEYATKLGQIEAEQKKQLRISAVKSALKVDESNADAVKAAVDMAESLMDLPEDKFNLHLSAIAKFTPAPLPPKSTPEKKPPQSTSLPAPLNGATASEDDPAEVNAQEKILDNLPKAEATISIPTDNGVDNLRKSIASLLNEKFGIKEEVN